MLAARPRCPNDRRILTGFRFATEFGASVDRLRIGPIPLDVRALERAVEDVVGTDLYEVRIGTVAGLSQPADSESVIAKGPIWIGLAQIDGRPRGGIDHDIGTQHRHRAEHLIAIPHIQRRPVIGRHVVARRGAMDAKIVTKLAARPGDQDAH